MPDARLAPLFRTFPMHASSLAAGAIGGVAIDVDVQAEAAVYKVYLLSAEGAAAGAIARTADEVAARRVWRLLARVLHKPRLVALPDGGYRAVENTVGALVTRAPLPRRGRRVALRRRPASRRLAPSRRGTPVVHANEREIVCYE